MVKVFLEYMKMCGLLSETCSFRKRLMAVLKILKVVKKDAFRSVLKGMSSCGKDVFVKRSFCSHY